MREELSGLWKEGESQPDTTRVITPGQAACFLLPLPAAATTCYKDEEPHFSAGISPEA